MGISNQTYLFSIGAKYRIYFYLKKGQEDIDGTKLELVGQNNKNISCDLNRHLRKRYIQNCQDYEVLCYEFGGEDIHSVIGGRLCSSQNWFLKQIQIQTCRTA